MLEKNPIWTQFLLLEVFTLKTGQKNEWGVHVCIVASSTVFSSDAGKLRIRQSNFESVLETLRCFRVHCDSTIVRNHSVIALK